MWHPAQKRRFRGRPLLYAAYTGMTSVRNRYSCLTGVVGQEHSLRDCDYGENIVTESRYVGQWFVDDIITDALGHHGYATGYVAWNPTAHPIGLYGQANQELCNYHDEGLDGGAARKAGNRRARNTAAAVKTFETVNTTRAKPMLTHLSGSENVFTAVQEHHVPCAGLNTMAAKVLKLGSSSAPRERHLQAPRRLGRQEGLQFASKTAMESRRCMGFGTLTSPGLLSQGALPAYEF